MLQEHRIPEGAEAYCAEAAARSAWLVRHFPPAMRTLPALLQHQSQHYGDRVLFRSGDYRLTYALAPALAARRAGALAAQGVKRGDRVALLCGNRPEFLELMLAVGWMGAVLVPINIASRGMQLQHILANCGARLLFIERDLLPALEMIDRTTLALETVCVIDPDTAALPACLSAMPAAAEPLPAADLKMSDVLAILYTSGTTGPSKGVCCPHGQYFWWAVYTGRQLGLREGDVLNTSLPLFHTNAFNCFFQALLNGGTQVLEPRFSVSKFWQRLRASEATVTYLLGAMVPMLMSRPPSAEERDHQVRIALAPGTPPEAQRQLIERSGIMPLDGFGSTESNCVIQMTLDNFRPGVMGRLAEGFQARVADEDGCEVPDGTGGELLLRADEACAFAAGYWGMPEKTVETWMDLWLHTGDRVVRDAEGYFRFLDRMKDAIRRRGENISSFEVEQVVQSHPAVAVSAAFPAASELAEDEVMVAVVLKQGASLDPEDLIRHCETRMPYFAVPRFVDVVADLPRTANGKVQKFPLREKGVTEMTWDREKAGVVVRR